jgi:hypothetical protein
LAAAALVADDFATAARGGDAEVLRLADHLGVKGEAQHAIKEFDGLLDKTGDTAWALADALGEGIGSTLETLAKQFPAVAPYLQQMADIMKGGLGGALDYAADQASVATQGGKGIQAALDAGGIGFLMESGLLGPQYVAPGVYSRGGQQYVPTTGEGGGIVNVPVTINTAGMTPAQIADEAAAQVRQQVLNAQAAMGVTQ